MFYFPIKILHDFAGSIREKKWKNGMNTTAKGSYH
jgi:hypothetical protein